MVKEVCHAKVVIDKPYRFFPPYRSETWFRMLRWCLPAYLKQSWGISTSENRGLEHLASTPTGKADARSVSESHSDDSGSGQARAGKAASHGSAYLSTHNRYWQQLGEIYLAQQLALYPPNYVASNPTPEHLLETLERFEEDLTDVATIHRPMRVVIQIGEAIVVKPERSKHGIDDPLMIQLDHQLRAMISTLSAEGTVFVA